MTTKVFKPSSYWLATLWSLTFHIVIILLIAVSAGWLNSEVKPHPRPLFMQVSLMPAIKAEKSQQPAIKTDKKSKQPQPKDKVKPAAKTVRKPKASVEQKQNKSAQPKTQAQPKKKKEAPPRPKKPTLALPIEPDLNVLLEQEAQTMQALEAQIQAEQAALAEEVAVVEEYMGLIRRSIEQQWSRPASARNGMETVLLVKLLPDGLVNQVTLIKSSGDAALDRAALKAMQRVGTLPVPDDPKIFDQYFRSIQFPFRPEDLPL